MYLKTEEKAAGRSLDSKIRGKTKKKGFDSKLMEMIPSTGLGYVVNVSAPTTKEIL